MAEDFIEDIYSDAYVITSMKKMLKYCRAEQWILFRDLWEDQKENIAELCRRTTLFDEKLGTCIWNSMVSISEKAIKGDLLSAADEMEEIIPSLYSAMQMYGDIDVTEGIYRLFSSKTGFLCVQNVESGVILNSVIDPLWEAYEKASAMINPRTKSLVTLGCNLGYLEWQAYELSYGSLDIYIYDVDRRMIDYALSYGTLDKIPEDKLHIYVNEDQDSLFDRFIDDHIKECQSDVTVVNVEDSIMNHLNSRGKDMASTLQRSYMTSRNCLEIMERNFYSNYKNIGRFIDELEPIIKDDWVIVGGGPSVDYNIDYLKSVKHKKTIIAVMTIYKRLLTEGITPDYIIVSDMQNRTFRQMEGVNMQDVPLLVIDTANWQFASAYQGEKYIVPCNNLYLTKILYDLKGIKTFEAMGTVTSFAILIAVNYGAKNIELVGVDLAYPNDQTHAKATIDYSIIEDEKLIEVKSVSGEIVKTSIILYGYISEIEEIVETNKDVRFFNKSRYGALIRGCENICD